MALWLRARQTVRTQLALLDAQLLTIMDAIRKTETKLDQTYQEIHRHAEDARKEVQLLRESGIRRGEQLDQLCTQYAWLKRVGTALLIATLIGLGSYAWDRLIRTPSMTTEHKIDKLLEQLKDRQGPQGP